MEWDEGVGALIIWLGLIIIWYWTYALICINLWTNIYIFLFDTVLEVNIIPDTDYIQFTHVYKSIILTRNGLVHLSMFSLNYRKHV